MRTIQDHFSYCTHRETWEGGRNEKRGSWESLRGRILPVALQAVATHAEWVTELCLSHQTVLSKSPFLLRTLLVPSQFRQEQSPEV